MINVLYHFFHIEQSEGQNRTERNIYEREEFYSSPDELQTSLYYLLERVSCKRDHMYLGRQGKKLSNM